MSTEVVGRVRSLLKELRIRMEYTADYIGSKPVPGRVFQSRQIGARYLVVEACLDEHNEAAHEKA